MIQQDTTPLGISLDHDDYWQPKILAEPKWE